MKYLGLALVGVFFLKMPTLAMGTLSEIVCGIETPQPGRYYECGVYPFRVFQVVSANGVIAHIDPRDFSSSAIRTMVYLRTDTSNMYEGMLIDQKDMYRCTGYFNYQTVLGASKRLPAFSELTREEREKIEAEIREAIRREKEEELRREREAEARKAKQEAEERRRYPIEQKERAAYAASKLAGVSFNWNEYVKMQKDLLRYVYSIEVTEKAWANLKNLQKKKDWLGMLGVIAGSEMKDYPDVESIDTLIEKLCQKGFHLEIKFTHKISVYVRERPFNTERFYEELHQTGNSPFAALFKAQGFHEELYHRGECLFKFSMERTNPARRENTIVFALENEGNRDIHKMDYEAESKKQKCLEDMKLGKIDKKECEAALRKLGDEYQRTILEWLETAVVTTSDDYVIVDRQKPMEPAEFMKQREAVFDRLSKMSFSVAEHFVIQDSLLPYIHSATVKENLWAELKRCHERGDYLGMLKLVSPNPGTFDENDIKCIYESEKALIEKAFHFEIALTHHILVEALEWETRGHSAISEKLRRLSSSDRGLIVSFKLGDADKIYVIESSLGQRLKDIERNSKELAAIRDIRNELGYGNISKKDGEARIAEHMAIYKRQIASWIRSATLRGEQNTLKKIAYSTPRNITSIKDMRSHGSESNKKKQKNGKKQNLQWVTCLDCDGAKYISKGKCAECGGKGKYQTPITLGIGGRPMGGRWTQCSKCKGKGEIKELCKGCKGRGKIKEEL